jgi:hypothetical protein
LLILWVLAPFSQFSILLGVSVFAAGVIGVRTFGGILVPAF